MTNKLNTPGIVCLAKEAAKQNIEAGFQTLETNWENREPDEQDPNCVVVYGVDKGEVYGYCLQKNFDEYVAFARELREMETKVGSKDLPFGKIKWIIPRAIELEMTARGMDVQEIMNSGDQSEIDAFIEDNFPELKTTSLILKKGKVPIIKP